jgi:hypothetical protein
VTNAVLVRVLARALRAAADELERASATDTRQPSTRVPSSPRHPSPTRSPARVPRSPSDGSGVRLAEAMLTAGLDLADQA